MAYQMCFGTRLYNTQENERFDFLGKDEGRNAIKKMLATQSALKGMPSNIVQQFADQIFDGLMTQVRSCPIGMRIDQWIFDQCPSLRASQRQSIEAQQRENLQALAPQIRDLVPPVVFHANASMNAAYALFASELLDNSAYPIAYQSAGFTDTGKRLLQLLEVTPLAPEHDRALVDAWSVELHIDDWVEWRPAV